MTELLAPEFEKPFGGPAISAYCCHGPVNLIGEHLDHNGRYVLPAATSRGTYLFMARNNDGVFRSRSPSFKEQLDIPAVAGVLYSGPACH